MKFKIFMNHLSRNGGAEIIAIDGAKMLAKKGHRVSICVPRNQVEKSLLNDLNKSGVSVIYIEMKNFTHLGEHKNICQKIYDQIFDVANFKLRNFIRNNVEKSDYVIVHKMRSLSPLLFKFLHENGNDFVYCMHDYELFNFNAKKVGGVTGSIYFYLFRRYFLKFINKICCPSNFMKSEVESFFDEEKIYVLSNFISGNFFCQDNKKYDVAFFGRLEQIKGIEFFCKTVSMSERKALIVGSGSLEKKLKKQFKNFQNIEFLGNLSHDSTINLMGQCKVVVVPSLWAEPFGLVAAEAAMCGSYLLLSDQGALPEVLNNVGGYGELIDKQSIIQCSVFLNVIERIFISGVLDKKPDIKNTYNIDFYYKNLIGIINESQS